MAARWEVVDVDFGLPLGHEQGSRRPSLVVSYDSLARANMATVCPLTSTARKPYPCEIKIPRGVAGLTMDSLLMVHQIRTVDMRRIGRAWGAITDADLRFKVETELRRLLGLGTAT